MRIEIRFRAPWGDRGQLVWTDGKLSGDDWLVALTETLAEAAKDETLALPGEWYSTGDHLNNPVGVLALLYEQGELEAVEFDAEARRWFDERARPEGAV